MQNQKQLYYRKQVEQFFFTLFVLFTFFAIVTFIKGTDWGLVQMNIEDGYSWFVEKLKEGYALVLLVFVACLFYD